MPLLMFLIKSSLSVPLKGRAPYRASNIDIPKLQMSTLKSYTNPFYISGAMYKGVPHCVMEI